MRRRGGPCVSDAATPVSRCVCGGGSSNTKLYCPGLAVHRVREAKLRGFGLRLLSVMKQ